VHRDLRRDSVPARQEIRMNSDQQPLNQSVEELLTAVIDTFRAMTDAELKLRHMQGLLLALAGSTIEKAIAEGWLRDAEMTTEAINATFAQHGFGWRLTRLQ
jgi:hypothetical protein